jgi:hypothetical protein
VTLLTTPARGDKLVHEYLDEQTAATITTGVEALVFARDRTDLAVNARDYVSLTAIEINRSGTRNYYWFGYLWSTIDRRSDDEPLLAGGDQLVLMADGRPIQLQLASGSLRELGIGQAPLPRPGRAAVPVAFPADPESVSFAALCSDLSLVRIRAGVSDEFALWRDAREALRNFAGHLGLESP